MKLGILLTSGMESEDARTVRQLSEAALRLGHEVSIFLMDDGVFQLPALKGLVESGAGITVCAHNALERGVPKVEKVLFGGQNDCAEIVHDVDRVVVFG
ncbi:MAG: DsrE family protein [Chloroflexota bacterium]|nr:DsrE family protein [Chloroflexota bacterium]